MSNNLKVKEVNSWDNLIIVVSRKCEQWQNIGNINIQHQSNTDSIPVFQYNDKPLFGFGESEGKRLTRRPILAYEAIKQLLIQLKNYINGTKNIYLLIHSEELGFNPETGYAVRFNNQTFTLSQRTTQKRHAVLEPNGQTQGDWRIYLVTLANDTQISGKHWELWEFIHEEPSLIYNCLSGKEDIYECLLTYGLKKNIIEPFSLLKHSIMTSFLDLDIDWQGIKEVNEKDKKNAKKYLNAILEKKSKNYYCQKLVNLWFYLTGNKDLKIESIHSSLEKDKLPYKKSVLDLINELDNDRKNNLKEKWTNLLSHVGLNVDLNDPYNIEKIKKDKESLIIFYLQNLDLMSQQNKEDKNVNIFLGKFEKKEDSKKEKEIIYFNFHEWYLKLGDLLEELKSFLE
jgi:hypothetical protein